MKAIWLMVLGDMWSVGGVRMTGNECWAAGGRALGRAWKWKRKRKGQTSPLVSLVPEDFVQSADSFDSEPALNDFPLFSAFEPLKEEERNNC